MKTIEDIGEFGLIDIIKSKIGTKSTATGIGDDCAIIPMADKEILISTDTLVSGVHFFEDADPYFLGRKSLAVNISDIAAMAGVPKWTFLSVSLNKNMSLDYIEKFMEGFLSTAEEFGVVLLGGDTTKSSIFTITVTIVGENEKNTSIKRKGAEVGDNIYVTGKIGCSYAGLIALQNKIAGFENIKNAHNNPKPKIDEAQKVKPFANAMIDISDGLLQDLGHICTQSGVGAKLDFEKIPFCSVDFVDKKDMLAGGEDYEIIFTASKKYENIINKMDNITMIGTITNSNGVKIEQNGMEINIKNRGFKHF